jgi:GTP-binding protein HflX
LTNRINREISVFINRKGNIVDISVGDNSTVALPEVEGRRGRNRLSGIRCIHTHPSGDGFLSAVDIRSLHTLRLDAMAAIGARDEKVNEIFAAIPARDDAGGLSKAEIYGPFNAGENKLNNLFVLIQELEKSASDVSYANDEEEERAILVGVEPTFPRIINCKTDGERMLDELEELAATAGVVIINKVLQKKPVRDPGYYIGKGKLEELSLMRQALNANLIIFDDELSGAQVRNIEELVGAKVVDRTTLILDIFAQRARSREGKIQVELAQLKYRLPRLIGLGSQLSRLGGGIGTRGPGEKKLEVDKRHIRRRIGFLESELKEISKRRGVAREGRKKNSIPIIALVGYTNAGKSTLMNTLCKSDVFAENKLFATLDPTTRSFALPDGREALLVDTVGFIRKLPHDLVEAFKSTLEETVEADVLLHIVDASSGEAREQLAVVEEILNGIGALNKPLILVLNKMDRVSERIDISTNDLENMIFEVSAITGMGLEELLEGIKETVALNETEVSLLAPYSEGWILPFIHQHGKIKEESYEENGTKIKAVIDNLWLERLKEYMT